MKATGIVRRIDDLGRVVIPKEIRRTMRIREGDPLEIFVSNEGEVIFKKYSPISELGSIAAQYCEVLYRTAGYPVLITDRDHVVAVSGISRREVLERRVSHGLEDQIENRRSFSAGDGQPLQPIEGVAYYALVQSPTLTNPQHWDDEPFELIVKRLTDSSRVNQWMPRIWMRKMMRRPRTSLRFRTKLRKRGSPLTPDVLKLLEAL